MLSVEERRAREDEAWDLASKIQELRPGLYELVAVALARGEIDLLELTGALKTAENYATELREQVKISTRAVQGRRQRAGVDDSDVAKLIDGDSAPSVESSPMWPSGD